MFTQYLLRLASNKPPSDKEDKYPRIYIRVSPQEAKMFKQFQEQGLSARDIICHSSRPCKCCQGIDVIAYDKQDNVIKIKRGILTERK